jgi:hypothetical protein
MDHTEFEDNPIGIIFNERYKNTINKFKNENYHLIHSLQETQNIRFIESIQNELRDLISELTDFDWNKKMGKPEYYAIFLSLITPLDKINKWEDFNIDSGELSVDSTNVDTSEDATCACGQQKCCVDYMGYVRCNGLQLLVGSVCVSKKQLTSCDKLIIIQREKQKIKGIKRKIFEILKGNLKETLKIYKTNDYWKIFKYFIIKENNNISKIKELLNQEFDNKNADLLQKIVNRYFNTFKLQHDESKYIDSLIEKPILYNFGYVEGLCNCGCFHNNKSDNKCNDCRKMKRLCERCGDEHKNRKVNRCNDCRNGICDECNKRCNPKYKTCYTCHKSD